MVRSSATLKSNRVPSRWVFVVHAYSACQAHVTMAHDALSVCGPVDSFPVIQYVGVFSACSPSD
eukprot:5023446-Prymnesium_polylepis.1